MRHLRSFIWGCLTVLGLFLFGMFALSVVLGENSADIVLPTQSLPDNFNPESVKESTAQQPQQTNTEQPIQVTIQILGVTLTPTVQESTDLVTVTPPPTTAPELLGGFGAAGANLPAMTATAASLLQGTKVQSYVNQVAATRTAGAQQAVSTRLALTQTASAWKK